MRIKKKELPEKSIAIIGAGIAGLAAGCYARMNGYRAEILEAHIQPGGMCTAWTRKGYTFDGCLHWFTGSSPASKLYQLWEELGAVQGRRMFDSDVFYRYIDFDGRTFAFYTDVDKLEAHLKGLSPADGRTIEQLCRLIRRFTKFQFPVGKAFELYNVFDIAKMMFRMRPFMKDTGFCNRTSVGEFAERFKDPLLREAFRRLLYDPGWTMMAVVSSLSLLHNRAGGFPEGGSLEIARAIENRFLCLGGKVSYGAKVDKVVVEDGRAVGLRLSGGREVRADYVISTADLKTTLFGMLGGKFMDPQHDELLKTGKAIPSCVQVSFGVDMDLSGDQATVGDWRKLETPLAVGRENVDWLLFRNFCFDPTLAPKGKSVVECMIMSDDFEYWEKLHADPTAYRAEKERILEFVTDRLDRIYPGFRSKIEATDVATPMTYVRYTGSWKGTFMTWVMTPENTNKLRAVKKTAAGLENFWLSGMWVKPPGGVPAAALCSRDVLQLICRKDGKRFKTNTPA